MGSSLTPRRPQIGFREADPCWIPRAPRNAHRLNGASLAMPYLEPFLIRVMRESRPDIERVAPHLIDDLDAFNRQEANHYRIHAQYNEILLDQYPGLDAYEAEIKRDFESFLPERGLAWSLAYCEGFECLGLIQAEFFLEEIDDVLEDADSKVVELWRWHLAEEFEHRSVTHDVLHAIYPGWRARLKGFRAFGRHLPTITERVADFMLEMDIERGRLPANARNLPSEGEFNRRAGRFHLPRIAKLMMPWYDPGPRTMRANTRKVLASYA